MRYSDAERETGAGWRRRARPCFGTRLAVSVRGNLSRAAADLAINRAFVTANAFHAAMSRQSPDSDLAAIACARPGETVAIGDATRAVIRLALEIAEDTAGLFDPVVRRAGSASACWRDVALVAGGVHVRQPLELSLDGIAKGYAADRLCTDICEAGLAEVIVDAGGDLSLACEAPQRIGVRDPVRSDAIAQIVELASGGVATSAAYGGISELWGPRGGARWPGSVSVVAPSCAVADAFTKVAALDSGAVSLFARWGARVLLLSRKDAA